MTAGYARLMAPESLRGKAMAVAMAGTPLALAFGVPLGTFLGSFLGWRSVFGIISLFIFNISNLGSIEGSRLSWTI